MFEKTQVVLAGAGPGDESLVTLKLVECLKQADIILADRLVNKRIIELYANPNAEIIQVGKEGHVTISTAQEEINELIVKYANRGLKVLRLKGGDVAIYSNVADEIKTLQFNNINFEIIPGITAASGIAASLKIPLTARNIAPGVQIHSLSAQEQVSDDQYRVWALTNDTLVFYMSTIELNNLARNLIRFGSKDKPVAIVEQGTTPFQVNTICKLSAISEITKEKTFHSPTLIIVGDILLLSAVEKSTLNAPAFFSTLNIQNKKLHAL